MKDRIRILREKVQALASEARGLKSEAALRNDGVYDMIESVEDFLDYADEKLGAVKRALDAPASVL